MYVYLQVASRVPGGDEVRLLIFFHHPPTPHIYTLSLHDALPISFPRLRAHRNGSGERQPSGKVQNSSSANRKSLSGVSRDRKSTRLNSSHVEISYAVFCLKKKNVPHPVNRAGRGRQRPPRLHGQP